MKMIFCGMLGGVLGLLLQSMGYGFLTFQFWGVMSIVACLMITASQA